MKLWYIYGSYEYIAFRCTASRDKKGNLGSEPGTYPGKPSFLLCKTRDMGSLGGNLTRLKGTRCSVNVNSHIGEPKP